jgi:integrase
MWRLTYRVYAAGKKPQRIVRTIGPSEGPGRLTEKQAERFAYDHYLKPLDELIQRPLSTMTVGEYWEKKYGPGLKLYTKKSTQNQYISLYSTYIKPFLGAEKFHDITPDSVEALVADVLGAGKSKATAKHVRKVLGAIFDAAKRSKVAFGENPVYESRKIKVEPKRPKTSLNPDQFRALLSLLPSATKLWSQPYREMAFTAAITSMNAAELCGLRWRAVNLEDEFVALEGLMIPPRSLAVLEHWKLGQYTSLKTENRSRVIPIPDDLREMLMVLKMRTECGKPHQPVFSSREGTPIDADNVRARFLRPAAESLGLIGIGWHSFRRTNANQTNAAGMNAHDRKQVLGHGSMAMVDHYTAADLERTRSGLQEVARVLAPEKERVQ